jgi:hypothetical protein
MSTSYPNTAEGDAQFIAEHLCADRARVTAERTARGTEVVVDADDVPDDRVQLWCDSLAGVVPAGVDAST